MKDFFKIAPWTGLHWKLLIIGAAMYTIMWAGVTTSKTKDNNVRIPYTD